MSIYGYANIRIQKPKYPSTTTSRRNNCGQAIVFPVHKDPYTRRTLLGIFYQGFRQKPIQSTPSLITTQNTTIKKYTVLSVSVYRYENSKVKKPKKATPRHDHAGEASLGKQSLFPHMRIYLLKVLH